MSEALNAETVLASIVELRESIAESRKDTAEQGKRMDEPGKLIDKIRECLDEQGRLLDEQGRLLDEHKHFAEVLEKLGAFSTAIAKKRPANYALEKGFYVLQQPDVMSVKIMDFPKGRSAKAW